LGFQGNQPVVVLRSATGSITYTPTQQNMPNQVWAQHSIPLTGSTTWQRQVTGTPDLARVSALEIHQDTWDYGFTVYYDGVQFNAPPTISDVADRSTPAGGSTGPVPFTVSDLDTPLELLGLVASSSNSTLVPGSGVSFGGSGSNRTVTITPAAGQTGTATITLTVTDFGGLTASDTFVLTVTPPPPPPPAVSVARVADAAEPGTAGVVQFTRTGDTSAALTVTYTVGGTATPGADYTALSGTVTFAARQTTYNLFLAPIDDTAVEGSETVVVTLTAGAGYTVSGPPATVAVADNDSPPTNPNATNPPSGSLIVDDNATQPPLPLGSYAGWYAAGTDTDVPAVAALYNSDGTARFVVAPFGTGFTGGVRVAVGDVDGDGVPDLIAAAGPGGGPMVAVYNGRDGSALGQFFAFEPSFAGGLYVAAADLTGDGRAEIVVSPDLSGGPRVRVVSGADGSQNVADFYAIDDPNFRGGVRVSVGDVNGDGVADLLVGAGFGGGPRVSGYDGRSLAAGTTLQLFHDFFAFEDTLRNGVFVAVGDVNGDGRGDLIFGGGPGGGPRVYILDGAAMLAGQVTADGNFFAGDPSGRDGVRVAILPAGSSLVLIVAVNITTQSGGIYKPDGSQVQSLNPAGGGQGQSVVAGAPFDRSYYVIRAAPTTNPPAGTIEFNHSVVAANLKGRYTGTFYERIENLARTSALDPDFIRSLVEVTLDIDGVSPDTPQYDPAIDALGPYTYSVTGRLNIKVSGRSPIDRAIQGTFTLTQFPKDPFTPQLGTIRLEMPAPQGKVTTLGVIGDWRISGILNPHVFARVENDFGLPGLGPEGPVTLNKL
jgi:hypothetical protein